jgi:hypothetical protein
MSGDEGIEKLIALEAQAGLTMLAPHLRSWASNHLIEPCQIKLATNSDGSSIKTLWLVTDHTGKYDSSYRVVYDENEQAFGLEVTLDTGVEWYMGVYGNFSETIENM